MRLRESSLLNISCKCFINISELSKAFHLFLAYEKTCTRPPTTKTGRSKLAAAIPLSAKSTVGLFIITRLVIHSCCVLPIKGHFCHFCQLTGCLHDRRLNELKHRLIKRTQMFSRRSCRSRLEDY